MKLFKNIISLITLFSIILLTLAGCGIGDLQNNQYADIGAIEIVNGGRISIGVGHTLQLNINQPDDVLNKVVWKSSNDCVKVDDNGLVTGLEVGKAAVTATYGDLTDKVLIEVLEAEALYDNISKDEFYKNYKPAESYMDAQIRTEHGLMSGSIRDQLQEPTISENRPMENGYYIRNSSAYYLDGGNTYVIIDSNGNIVTKVFKGGAYVILEEVAAYVLAFGDVPANYVSGKNVEPENTVWGEYLRLNHSKFSGNTKKYPYEPELPNISGCGGDLQYYEIDIGTTGTDCSSSHAVEPYNNGSSIIRGAARIVYTRFDKNKDQIIDINEKFVFYTYNHYNDFQEYLNYYGGWGEMFGNITGGGSLSSKYNYNPTPYVPVIMKEIKCPALELFLENDVYIIVSILPTDLYYTKKF